VTNTDRGFVERTLKTDKAGFYTAPSLPLGTYSVTIVGKGSKTAAITGIMLHANDALKVDQKLVAGGASETVSTVSPLARVNLENGNSEGLITRNQVTELPLVTRNYESLITLQPGVSYGGSSDRLYLGASLPSGTSNQVLFSINGDRPTMNNWTVDGGDNVNRGGANALVTSGGQSLLTYPSVDAISEVVTLRGTYAAEFGRNGGAQINVATRSGTNAFHGDAYEFFRNDVLNANNYFNKLVSPGIPTPTLRYNDLGVSVGGPVIIPHYNGRNKTFFYFSEEVRRVVNDATTMTLAPTQAEIAGNFSTGFSSTGVQGPVAVCGQFNTSTGACTAYTTQTGTAFSKTAQGYVTDIYSHSALPQTSTTQESVAGNLAAGLDPHTLIYNARSIFHDTQEFARIDHAMGTRVNLFYRYLHDDLPSVEEGGLFVNGTTPSPSSGPPSGLPVVQKTFSRSPGTEHMGHATIVARPNFLIDMGYAYSSGGVFSTPVGYAALYNAPDVVAALGNGAKLPFPFALGVVPSLSFGGNVTGVSSAGNYRQYSRNHNGYGDFIKIIQQHTFKFGVSYNHYQNQENASGNASPYPQGKFSFSPGTAPTAAQLTALGPGVSAPGAFDASFGNFLIGNANNGFTQASEAVTPNINENLIELYLQDDWRAMRRLTLNLGVRYSYFGQPYDINRELSNFDPAIYNSFHAETISSNGNLCTLALATAGGQVTYVTTFAASGPTTTYTLNNCANVNGLNAYQPNTGADALNGIIYADSALIGAEDNVSSPNFPYSGLSGTPSIISHASPFGEEVGHAEKHDFAPRIGFAYDLYGNGKTALRGGYGMFYDASAVTMYQQAVFNNPPFAYVTTYPSAVLDNPQNPAPANVVGPGNTPPAIYGTPVTYQTPYVQQFSLDVQQVITPTMTLDVGYFGDHGTHLLGRVDINENQPGAFLSTSIGFTQMSGCGGFISQACEGPLNQIRPYLGYTAINTVETIFNQNYNSLQAKFIKRFSGKSMIDVNYTFSRGLTNAPTDLNSAPQNSYNLAAEYGPTAFNRSDMLTVDGIWEMPWYRDQQGVIGKIAGGWQLSGIYVINSGLPLTATMNAGGTVSYGPPGSVLTSTYNGQTNGGVATDAAGLGILGPSLAQLRPSVVLNPNAGYAGTQLRTRAHWFNQTAFLAPPQASFQVGNERPGMMNGPGFNKLDMALFRTFNLPYRTSFTLRGEGYNVFNHTNWATIGTVATSSQFGTATSARDPRIVQIAAKFNF
jgi:hypothetical protein